MESYIEYTNDEDVAILQIVLEEYQIEHTTTSYAQNGNVIAKIEINSDFTNHIKLGYEICQRFQTVKDFIDDQYFPNGWENWKESFLSQRKEYQERYAKKIIDAKPLFEIECPQYYEVELPNGEKAKIEYDPDLIMDDEEYQEMIRRVA